MNNLEASLRSWTNSARAATDKLKKLAERTESLCRSYEQDPELIRAAKVKRQATVRAAAAIEASRLIPDAHAILHKGSREVAKRSLPTIPEESGLALLLRMNVEQVLALPENEVATLIMTDRETRQNLMAGMTAVERRKLSKNPLVDINQFESQTLLEHNPHIHEAVDNCQQAQAQLLGVCSRVLAGGMTAQSVPVEGFIPDEAGQGAVDIARQYNNLPDDWDADLDPVHQASVTMMANMVETSHLVSEGGAC